jgi:hypothetical protein
MLFFFLFLLSIYVLCIYPTTRIDNERVFVENMLRLQELNRKQIKQELMNELAPVCTSTG